MEKNKEVLDLTVNLATAEQRKNILEMQNHTKSIFRKITIPLVFMTVGSGATLPLDVLRKKVYDAAAIDRQELYEECLFPPHSFLLDFWVISAILLIVYKISNKFDTNMLLKSISRVGSIVDNSWAAKLFELLEKLITVGEPVDEQSLLDLLNLDYQAKNLTYEKANDIITQFKTMINKIEFSAYLTHIITFGGMTVISLIFSGSNRAIFTDLFNKMGLWLMVLIALKRMVFLSSRTIDPLTLKTLSEINLKVFDCKEVLVSKPVLDRRQVAILGEQQLFFYTFENEKEIPFFTLHWADELTRLGFKVISADQNRVIFLKKQRIDFNVNLKNEVDRLNKKRQRYNVSLANLERLKKFLYNYNKALLHPLTFNHQAIDENWYYVAGHGPDAFVVIPFTVNFAENLQEKSKDFEKLLKTIFQSNLVYELRENNLIIKSIFNFDAKNLSKELSHLNYKNSDVSPNQKTDNLTVIDTNLSVYSYAKDIHKRLPVKVYKIKIPKTDGPSTVRWNFTENKIVKDTENLQLAEVPYADFELDGNKFHVKAKNLNILNVNGILTNTLVFFNQTAKEICDFKAKNNSEYKALKSLARSAQTVGYGIKKVPKETNQAMFFRPQDCKDNEVYKVKGHTGIRIFGAKKTDRTDKIEVTYSNGEKQLVDGIIDIKHVLYKHQ